jgi:hypothetical protein
MYLDLKEHTSISIDSINELLVVGKLLFRNASSLALDDRAKLPDEACVSK